MLFVICEIETFLTNCHGCTKINHKGLCQEDFSVMSPELQCILKVKEDLS